MAGAVSSIIGRKSGGDPLFTSVPLLLHFDGADGSVTFTDSSADARTVTRNFATISTAQSLFGGSSGLFSGGNSWLRLPAATSRFSMNGKDYTIDLAFRPTALADYCLLNHRNSTSGIGWQIWTAPSGAIYIQGDGGSSLTTAASAYAAGVWNRLRISKVGGTVYIFVGGTFLVSGAVTIGNSSSELLGIGRREVAGSFFYYDGYMDELRLTEGVARSTANYTLDATAFPNA